jgi:pimeloyl-ACP methyl ester carboxylesterase
MNPSKPHPIVFLPGVIMPAEAQYRRLLKVLDVPAPILLKDLEVYAGERPAPDYDLQAEMDDLGRAADEVGFDRFHLVGYSGGGAVALAFAGAHPERVMSLALGEPAVIPTREWMQAEAAAMHRLELAMTLPPEEQMREFVRIQVKPGVQPPPPPADPPPWMAKRPAGMIAMSRAFLNTTVSMDELRRFQGSVYLAIGSLSDTLEERKAEVLAKLFPDFRCEVYEGRHHFDPPQRTEPERLAKALKALWERAEEGG